MSQTDPDRIITVLIGRRGCAQLGTIRLGDWFENTFKYRINGRDVVMSTVNRNVRKKSSRYIGDGLHIRSMIRDNVMIWYICSFKCHNNINDRGGVWPRDRYGGWPSRSHPLRVIDITPADIREYMQDIADADTYGIANVDLAPDDDDITYDDGVNDDIDVNIIH